MQRQNRVTIYSNGIADFVRNYKVNNASTKISIPAKTSHVGDILASLNIFGKATLTSPPTFSPSNNQNGTLEIGTDNVVEELVQNLSGAQVSVKTSVTEVKGTLVGLHSDYVAGGGERVERKYIVVLTTLNNFEKIQLEHVISLRFTDETVNAEITKALQRNFQQVKPNSTFIDLTLKSSTAEETDVSVQYAVPNAAWKISYRLNDNSKTGVEFKGMAIVDNNTEEDWNDAKISVVTGEPITFSTDLADSKIPLRSHVNVVKESAAGAVEVDRDSYGIPSSTPQARSMSFKSSKLLSESVADDTNSMCQMASGMANLEYYSTSLSNTTVKEVGDFCIFEAKEPVTIAANRSAIIPVFDVTLPNAKTVLHYKKANNPERPYRSVQMKNDTKYSLGRGVVTLYHDGNYSGSAVLPAMKQGEEQLVPYALETGVRVKATEFQSNNDIVQIKIDNGVCFSETTIKNESTFLIANAKNEAFEIFIDVDQCWGTSKFVAYVDGEEQSSKILDKGVRYILVLRPCSTLTLKVFETLVQSNKLELIPQNQRYFISSFIANDVLAKNPQIQEIVAIFGNIEKLKQKLQQEVANVAKLTQKQDRLRKNIAMGNGPEVNGWLKDLGIAETQITTSEEVTTPELNRQILNLEVSIAEKFKNLSVEMSK